MVEAWDRVTKVLGAAAGAVLGFLGGWSPLVVVWVAFMVFDYLTGVVIAWLGKSPKSADGGPSSKVGWEGIAKKGFSVVIVLMAVLLDSAFDMSVIQTAVIMFYVANEGLSILENGALLNVPMPPKMKELLLALKTKAEKPPDA